MFSISFGSVFSSIIAVILLSIYGFFFITQIRHSVYRDMRLLILLLFITGIRLLTPFNLPVNITIPSKHLLIPLQNIVFYRIPDSGLFLYEILFFIVFLISIVLLLIKGLNFLRFCRDVHSFVYQDKALDDFLSTRTVTNKSKNASAVYTDIHFIRIINPVIVIPRNVYSEKELSYILDHEIKHIDQNDLLYKAFFNVLTAFFWWNPFIWLIRQQADNAIEISNDISLYSRMNEQEKADYAALLVKTAKLSNQRNPHYSLSLGSHNDPLIKRRVEDILHSPATQNNHLLYIIHILVMTLIIITSFIVTPEPYQIEDDQIDNSFDLEEDLGANADNTYILETGDDYEKYELFVNGESLGTFHEIPEDLKDYPVYAEKPDADENPSDNQGDNKSTADDD